MKTLVTLLLACCFGSAMAQSNLPACLGTDVTRWTACFGTVSKGTGGYTYIGEFKDGEYNGQGSRSYAGRIIYVGEWKYGRHNGQGTYTFDSGNKYVGEFKDGEFNGQGIKFGANGKVHRSGIWKEGGLIQSKFIDVATFTRIPKLSNSASNLAQLRKTEEQAKQKQAELEAQLEAQRKATELALAQATKAAKEQVKLSIPLAAQQQIQIQIQIKPAAQIAPQGKRVAPVIGNASNLRQAAKAAQGKMCVGTRKVANGTCAYG